MKRQSITIKELSKRIKVSDIVLRTHLSCFEKYKIPKVRPYQYFYNYSFLSDLRDFYIRKFKSECKRHGKYKESIIILNRMINVLNRKNK